MLITFSLAGLVIASLLTLAEVNPLICWLVFAVMILIGFGVSYARFNREDD